MADKTQAMRPNVFSIPGYLQQEKVAKKGLTPEEQILAAGAGTGFWKILKAHIDNSIEQLEQINEAAIAQGMPLEEIGRNTLVISQTKGVLRKIVNVVNDAVEAVDNGQE